MSDGREFDVIFYGVTGWTGTHLAQYVVENYSNDGQVRFAFAARSEAKLADLIKRLCKEYADSASWISNIPLVIADALDEKRIAEVVQRTKVVATVVGPYALYGEPLVKACVKHDTHYADITGETPWIRDMILKYHDKAERNNTYIIPSCGFDSIPSDLGAFMMVDEMRKQFNSSCTSVRAYLTRFSTNNLVKLSLDGPKPGGGTMLSLVNLVETGMASLRDPYVLVVDKEQLAATAQKDKGHTPQILPGYDSKLPSKNYTTHFGMSVANEKVVRRSASLLSHHYGPRFSYKEAMAVSNPLYAVLISSLFTFLYAFLSLPFAAYLLRKVIPAPSQIPPERTKHYKPGCFELLFVAESDNSETLIGKVFGPDEAGYVETSKMLAESAFTLALELDKVKADSRVQGGVVTPAVLGYSLIKRLTDKKMIFKSSV